jgi:hypothetical protein
MTLDTDQQVTSQFASDKDLGGPAAGAESETPRKASAVPNECLGGVARNVYLCGHRFSPVRDLQRFPVCPRCKELAGMLGIGG